MVHGGVPQNGWFIREHPIKMDDLGVSPFKETHTVTDDLLMNNYENMAMFPWPHSHVKLPEGNSVEVEGCTLI